MNAWDKKFLLLSDHIAFWSKDPSSKVGAILIGQENRIKSVSYNGFPKKFDDNERLFDRTKKYKIIVHAEQNLICNCSKDGISTNNCIVAVSMFPCSDCAKTLISAGINKIITRIPSTEILSRWKENIDFSKQLLEEAKIKVVIIDY